MPRCFFLRCDAQHGCAVPVGPTGPGASLLAVDEGDDLLRQYQAVLAEMHEHRVEQGGQPRKWNRLVNKMQRLQLRLRESAEGREGITAFALNAPNTTAKSWAAVHALAWDPASVRSLLEAQAADDASLNGLDAKMALREFDAGRLDTTWVPKR